MNKKIVTLGIAMAAFVAAAGTQQAHAATTGDTVVTLEMQDNAAITVTPTATVTPTLAQIIAGEVTTATNPITLTLTSTSGSDVTLAGNGAGGLLNTDLALSSDGGTTWVGADDAGATTFYTSSALQNGATVPVKLKIINLGNYEAGVGGTNYTNTVTFTIVASD